MVRFDVEVSNLVQTIEGLRKTATDLLYAINEKNGELAHVDFMCLKITLTQINDQVGLLTRKYEMALADDSIPKDN